MNPAAAVSFPGRRSSPAVPRPSVIGSGPEASIHVEARPLSRLGVRGAWKSIVGLLPNPPARAIPGVFAPPTFTPGDDEDVERLEKPPRSRSSRVDRRPHSHRPGHLTMTRAAAPRGPTGGGARPRPSINPAPSGSASRRARSSPAPVDSPGPVVDSRNWGLQVLSRGMRGRYPYLIPITLRSPRGPIGVSFQSSMSRRPIGVLGGPFSQETPGASRAPTPQAPPRVSIPLPSLVGVSHASPLIPDCRRPPPEAVRTSGSRPSRR